MKAGTVWYVGAGPGDPELISVLGQRLLREAQVVFHDTGVAPELLEICPHSARVEEARVSHRATSTELETIALEIAKAARAGLTVVRLKVGDPLFFSRALDELAVLNREAVDVRIIPGIAAPLGAAAFTGLPLTPRMGSGAAVFVSVLHVAEPSAIERLVRTSASSTESACFLCTPTQASIVLAALRDTPRWHAARAAVVSQATNPEQSVLEAPIAEVQDCIAAHPPAEPLLLMLSDSAQWRQRLAWFEAQPLFGRRLLLCRPKSQARESSRAIRARGARAIVKPLIEIGPPDDPSVLLQVVPRLGTYDWVVLTSANGAERLMTAITTAGLDARAFGRAKIAVIGPGTARPLARWGLTPDVISEEHVAESLGRELLRAPGSRSVLLVRAEVARDALPRMLGDAGLQVSVVAAYRTRKIGTGQSAELRALVESRTIDAVLLTSSSMAESLSAALGPEAPEILSCTRVASIGPITTSTLNRLGIRVDITADEYTVEGLLDALEKHFAHPSL